MKISDIIITLIRKQESVSLQAAIEIEIEIEN